VAQRKKLSTEHAPLPHSEVLAARLRAIAAQRPAEHAPAEEKLMHPKASEARKNAVTRAVGDVATQAELEGALEDLAARVRNIQQLSGLPRRGESSPSFLTQAEEILLALLVGLRSEDDELLKELHGPAARALRKHKDIAERTGLSVRQAVGFGAALVAEIMRLQSAGIRGVAAAPELADLRLWRAGPFIELRNLQLGHPLMPKLNKWCSAEFEPKASPEALARGLLRALGIEGKAAENAVAGSKA